MAKKSDLKVSAAAVEAPRANARGIAALDLGARKIKLKMTLGAMADIEDEFEVESLEEAQTKLKSTKDLARFIAILARAAGEDVEIEEIRHAPIEITAVKNAIAATMLDATDAPEADAGNAPAPSA